MESPRKRAFFRLDFFELSDSDSSSASGQYSQGRGGGLHAGQYSQGRRGEIHAGQYSQEAQKANDNYNTKSLHTIRPSPMVKRLSKNKTEDTYITSQILVWPSPMGESQRSITSVTSITSITYSIMTRAKTVEPISRGRKGRGA